MTEKGLSYRVLSKPIIKVLSYLCQYCLTQKNLIALKNRHSDIDNHHDGYYVVEKTSRGVKKLSSSLMKQR